MKVEFRLSPARGALAGRGVLDRSCFADVHLNIASRGGHFAEIRVGFRVD